MIFCERSEGCSLRKLKRTKAAPKVHKRSLIIYTRDERCVENTCITYCCLIFIILLKARLKYNFIIYKNAAE